MRLSVHDLACRRGDRLLFRGLTLDLQAGDGVVTISGVLFDGPGIIVGGADGADPAPLSRRREIKALKADIERLSQNVPKQEAGRVSNREISVSRANRSVRLFEHVVESLAAGINTVFQHVMLVPTLTVFENLVLGDAWWRRPPRAAPALRITGLADRFEGSVFTAFEVEHGEPAPEARLDHFVHGRSITDTVLDKAHRLAPERRGQPVGDMPHRIFFQPHGRRAEAAVEPFGPVEHLRIGAVDFDQRHQMRRVERVAQHHPRRICPAALHLAQCQP